MMLNKKLAGKLTTSVGQGLILVYKNILSDFLSSGQILIPSTCRFYPSCSVYAQESLDKHGLFKGGWMSLKRILKCNPFYDFDF